MPPEASLASGYIIPGELADQNVCVFVSHGHGDHYSETIFEWKETLPGIRYVMGFEPDRIPPEKYFHMPPRSEKDVDGMKISTIRSTDEGVAFMVQADGLTIFHAGDHANGHDEKSTLYKKEIDHLAKTGLRPDISFFPITGCGLGDPDSVREGVVYAMKKLHPKLLFPMHGGDATYRYLDFAEAVSREKGDVEIRCALDQGDRFRYMSDSNLTRR
jgi:L-ascorbate metabolism protein UlaG (beta-lactamase superfamily)